MARLIDADTLRKEVENDRDASDMPKMWYQGIEYAINHIINAPTVDAELVRHGRWDCKGFEPVRCSVCGITVDAINGIPWAIKGFKFCPHCGAKMDEVEDADT